jgi:two-component system, cell cycle response regulator
VTEAAPSPKDRRSVERAEDRRREGRIGVTTVLVVDDSTAIRRILRRALEGGGHRVVEAGDGKEGLQVCRTERPDLVLLDVDMPVMDGLTTLQEMKMDPLLVHVPVLFLTARTGGEDLARGLDLGAHDYLRKPCDPVELQARVSGALRLAAQEQELRRRTAELDALSTTDQLTGIGNRRRLEARTAELGSVLGPTAGVGVVLLDVDHFKAVNDTEGHPVGDLVLRILAGRLGSEVRSPATLVRWGGEEFLVLAPGLDAAGLADLGERLRAAVGASPFAVGDGKLLDIHVSAGCAAGGLDTFEQTVQAADEALYEAKTTGRNRVVTRS